MSFTFGSPSTTTAGSTFGTTTPSTGFSFGSGDAAKPFGAPAADNKPAFNFGSPNTNAPAFPSFSFGAKTATTTAAASSLFSSPTTTAQPTFGASKPSYFGGFNAPPNQTVGSPGFGAATQNQPATQNVLGMSQPQATPAPTFGTPTTQAAQPTGGFSFGASSTPAQGGTPTFGGTTALGGGATALGGGASTLGGGATALGGVTSSLGGVASSLGGGATQIGGGANTLGGGTLGGVTSTPAGPTAGGFSFAATPASGFSAVPAASTSAPATQPSFLGAGTPAPASSGFGAASGFAKPSFSFGTPAATSAPAAAASFGAPTPALGATSSAPQAVSFAAPAPTQPTSAPSFGAPQASLSFGAAAATNTTASTALSFAATATPTAAAAPTAAATTGGLSFGGAVSSAAPTLNFGVSSTAATSAPASTAVGGFSLTAKPIASSAATVAASTSAPSGITALSKTTTAAVTLPSLTTATTTTPAAPPAMVSSITFAQLEENINKWTLELEEQEKTFINQATQINAWDRLLIANGEKIVELNEAVQGVKNEQQSLEHELDFVVAQQNELEQLLAPLERARPERADPERDHMYSLAENLDTQLRQMSEDLKEVIEHLNETNRSQDSNDPIVQIGRILNAHMSSMQWVDNSIAQISTKLDQLKATHDTLRRDNERSFQLTYN